MNDIKDFDVLLSFASPERVYARAISDICKENGLEIFLDEDFQHEIWGKNLVEYLDETYRSRGKYCVALISEAYCQRPYTKVERHSAFDKMIETDSEYFLPVLVEDAWPKGLPRATAYLDLRVHGVIGVCELLIRKIKNSNSKLTIPNKTRIPRIPIGKLKSEHLSTYLLEICQKQPINIFGTVVYSDKTAEIKKLFSDQNYWDALDEASGPNFEVFAIRDEEDCEVEYERAFEMMTASSSSRSRSKTYYFSKLLKEYFGEERTRMAYPSVLLFIASNGKVRYSRLIPFRRDTVENIFIQLQDLFSLVSDVIAEWKKSHNDKDVDVLWSDLKSRLLEQEYTLYIQNAPSSMHESISKICTYVENQPATENG